MAVGIPTKKRVLYCCVGLVRMKIRQITPCGFRMKKQGIRLIARRKANIKILRQRLKALRGSQPKLSKMSACEEEMSAAVKQRKTKTSKKSKKESETEWCGLSDPLVVKPPRTIYFLPSLIVHETYVQYIET